MILPSLLAVAGVGLSHRLAIWKNEFLGSHACFVSSSVPGGAGHVVLHLLPPFALVSVGAFGEGSFQAPVIYLLLMLFSLLLFFLSRLLVLLEK